jgi:hypothetical protein
MMAHTVMEQTVPMAEQTLPGGSGALPDEAAEPNAHPRRP